MIKLLLVIFFIDILGCARVTPKRSLASSHEDPFSEEISKLKLEDFKFKFLSKKLHYLLEARLLAHDNLVTFDEKLSKAKSIHEIMSDPTYEKLLVLRLTIEESEEELKSYYQAMHYLIDLGSEDKIKAENLLKEIHSHLSLLTSNKELALQYSLISLAEHFHEVDQEIGTTHEEAKWMKNILSEKKNLSLQMKSVGKRNVGLFKERLDLDKFLKKTLNGAQFKLDNQSTNMIKPSTGPEGNINGNEFSKNTWSLTFDDGPSAKHTPKMLEILEDHEVKASFFELAKKVQALTEISLKVRDSGHEMSNHSFSHLELTKQADEGLNREITEATNIQAKIWGKKPRYFRLPYGAGVKNQKIRELIAKNQMIHVFWNVDTLDWQDKNPDSIVERAMKQINLAGRGIILFHDIHDQTLIATDKLIKRLKEKNVRFLRVGDAVDEVNKSRTKASSR